MSIYADTCFFVSLYLSDRHTPEVERRVAARPTLWMTPLHVAEWVHAVQQHVFRKTISNREAERLIQRFQEHLRQGVWRDTAVPDRAFELCEQLAERHAGRLGVRTLDTLHVASALELKAEEFWTFDQRQARLAAAAGVPVG